MSVLKKGKRQVHKRDDEGRARAYFETLLDTPEARAEGLAVQFTFAIARERDRLGLSDSELARRMGVSRQRVSKLMSGTQNSTLGSLVRLAETVGLACELKLKRSK